MKDKSVMVIDTPKTCIECPFCEELDPQEWWGECCITKKNIYAYGDEEIKVPEWCPLRPLPEKAAVDESMLGIGFDDFNTLYYLGFNECIDMISGFAEELPEHDK